MPMIRLIATDMDATLLDDKSEVTPRTAHAVTRAMEAGARFVIASGRMYETARPYAEPVSYTPLDVYKRQSGGRAP